jgi:hypothetical protein
LKSYPDQLQRCIEHCNNKDGGHDSMNANVDHHSKTSTIGTSLVDEDLTIPNFFQEEYSIVLVSSPNKKIDPFYISLFINGNKLSNCIIDSRASDNVMSSSIAKALGILLTKTFSHCYSMDAKQVPLFGQIKDAQVSLAAYPFKRLKLTILELDILPSYGMLLSRSLCKEMVGEIKLDWSYATILVGNKREKLEP